MKTKRTRGFTLTELMVAIVTVLIVVLATGAVMSMGHRNWRQAWERTNLQRDASYAVLKISQLAKRANSAVVDNEGKAVTINTQDGSTRISFTNQDIYLQANDGPVQTVLEGEVEDVTFTVNDGLLGIDLKLEKNHVETHLVTTVLMRNFGE